MFKNSIYAAVAFVMAMLVFSSCKKSSNAGKLIPKDAAFVMVLNGESITKKLPWEEIKKGPLVEELMKDTIMTDFKKKLMEDPKNSGLALNKDMTVFLVKDSTGGYGAFTGIVDDAAKFKAFAADAMKKAVASEKDGINFMMQDNYVVSWKKDRFIIVADIPEMRTLSGMPSSPSYDDNGYPIRPVSTRNLILQASNLYNLDEKNSMGKDDKFNDCMSEKGDIHFYASGENFSTANLGMAALGMLNLGKLTEGSIATGVANFEDGKIVLDFKSYSGKELSALWKKYSGGSINTDMITRAPIQDKIAAVAFSFQPEGLKAFVQLAGLEGFANLGAGQFGFTMDDFIKANKGEIALVMGDFKMKDSSSYSADPSFLFSAAVKDKSAFDKLVAAGQKGLPGPSEDVAYSYNDKYFVIGSSKTVTDTYLAGNAKKTNDLTDQISGSPFGGFVNFQSLFTALKTKNSSENEAKMYDTNKLFWDNLLYKGGEFKNNSMNQHIEINLVDKKTNSLKQLNDYLTKMYMLDQSQKVAVDYTTPYIDSSVSVESPMVMDSAQ